MDILIILLTSVVIYFLLLQQLHGHHFLVLHFTFLTSRETIMTINIWCKSPCICLHIAFFFLSKGTSQIPALAQ